MLGINLAGGKTSRDSDSCYKWNEHDKPLRTYIIYWYLLRLLGFHRPLESNRFKLVSFYHKKKVSIRAASNHKIMKALDVKSMLLIYLAWHPTRQW